MLEPRSPVIGIFGHIDHGKSTLLDYIRKTNIVAEEAGAITQHISAYEVTHTTAEGKVTRITFLDTPGHEAFKGIRTRGAGAADIAVLVVSAEDGVKPQTLEALAQIKERGMPYLVAATKTDKPNANIDKVKGDLAENGVLVEGYGGDVPIAAVSAKTGDGISEFLDTLVLIAELEGFKADRSKNGEGVIIESFMDPKKGITATGIVKDGTVRKGMFAATAGAWAPLRFLVSSEGENVEELSFSSPVQIVGWDNLPETGSEFKTFESKKRAVEFAQSKRNSELVGAPVERVKSDAIPLAEGMEVLPLIIKADTAGSLDAIIYELGKLKKERISAQAIVAQVGAISEGDIKTALSAPGSVVVGFSVKTDAQAAALAERSGIEIYSFDVIYELTEKIDSILAEREPRVEVEEVTGRSKILKIFSATKNKQVLGGKVLAGTLERGAKVRIIRRESVIGNGMVKELQQAKAATSSVNEGTEFGALIESRTELAPNDIIESVVKVTK